MANIVITPTEFTVGNDIIINGIIVEKFILFQLVKCLI